MCRADASAFAWAEVSVRYVMGLHVTALPSRELLQLPPCNVKRFVEGDQRVLAHGLHVVFLAMTVFLDIS